MKIIISHDVDHLFWDDHIRDFVYPKLWIRETESLFKRNISFKEWFLRVESTFSPVRNCINKVMQFDEIHHVPSTFFFGVSNGLGLSYKKERALPMIRSVQNRGFAVGIHGIDFFDLFKMRQEYNDYFFLTGERPVGIRMHYARHDKDTFEKLAGIGYQYDSTEFDKNKGSCIKEPYKIREMWEFPISIMDSYLPVGFDLAKKETLRLLSAADNIGISYFTVLFHDPYYNDAYLSLKLWYEWFITYIEGNGQYQFISFSEAVNELRRA